MLTRTPPLRSIVFTIVFFIAAFGLLLFVWQRFGGVTPLRAQGYRVHVHFAQAQNLQPNADVRMAGVKIGRIASVTATTKLTDAVLEIEPRYVPLGQGTRVITRVKTLLGETFVALAPGPRSAPPVPDGGSIANANVAPTQQLDEVLGAFDAKTRRTVRRYMEQTADTIDGRGYDLNQALGNLGPTAEDLDALISELDAERAGVAKLVSGTGEVFAALARRPESLRDLVRAGDEVLATTDEFSGGLRRTVDALVTLQRELTRSTRSGLAAARLARPTLRVLRPASANAQPAIAGAERLGHQLTGLFEELPPSLGASRKGLPATGRMLDIARPLNKQLLATGRELVPVIDLGKAYTRDLIGGFASLGASLEGTARGTDGVDRHYLRALLTVNGETSAKNSVRPSANRHNAYARPGWLNDLTNGPLKSSDCNIPKFDPLTPPVVVGIEGPPPCVVQGGWQFRGDTRYYPQMAAAP